MVSRIGPVTSVTEIGSIANVYVYRNSFVPASDTSGISLTATDAALPATLGATLAHGTFLNAATARYPAVVLGAEAASLLGINNLAHPTQVWIGGHWFTVVGILNPVRAALPDGQHGLHRVPHRRAVLRLRRPPHRALPAQRSQPGQRRGRRPARHREPGQPLRRGGQLSVGHPESRGGRQGGIQRAAPRSRRRGPPRRRRRHRQRHGHLRPRTPLRDRPAPGPGRHPPPRRRAVPRRGRCSCRSWAAWPAPSSARWRPSSTR